MLYTFRLRHRIFQLFLRTAFDFVILKLLLLLVLSFNFFLLFLWSAQASICYIVTNVDFLIVFSICKSYSCKRASISATSSITSSNIYWFSFRRNPCHSSSYVFIFFLYTCLFSSNFSSCWNNDRRMACCPSFFACSSTR